MTLATQSAIRLAGISVLLVFAACGETDDSPEGQIQAWIDAVHAAAEAKDRNEIIDRISPSYIDARGHSRDDVEKRLRVIFLRQNRVAFIPSVDEITVIGGTAAEASVTVAMAGTNSGALGVTADAYRFELELQIEGGEWKLISARWGELGRSVR